MMLTNLANSFTGGGKLFRLHIHNKIQTLRRAQASMEKA